ncbi:Lrp/AsnC family transcriptional regulator [Pseudooceanicola marinus]|uniref:Lrp/AsnC family transcriptional regulator n=1 Tax=Pseudooceanicola marinus TaxID=396013 RepID=UPI001C97B43E|nr:Lrp/AsnC family transcriptional regulator [Pseudooceanicola marinus]MBY5971643.1 Lrp/AsnC family transcriptional regulator [Ferrimonas balearica]MCA1336019.1 Lrp/AsnC family transcriptional regulator [Pseudooceanicola marinus]
MRTSNLDSTDRKILRELTGNARIPVAELARKVGLSKTPVAARLKALEDSGVITGYRATLSPRKLGLTHVSFVEVRLDDTRPAALEAFNAAVRRVPEIEECYMIAGGFDYLLKVRSHDMADYRRVMGEEVSTLPHVTSTTTFVSMEAVVEGSSPAL